MADLVAHPDGDRRLARPHRHLDPEGGGLPEGAGQLLVRHVERRGEAAERREMPAVVAGGDEEGELALVEALLRDEHEVGERHVDDDRQERRRLACGGLGGLEGELDT